MGVQYGLNGWTWNGWESRAEIWTGLFRLLKHFSTVNDSELSKFGTVSQVDNPLSYSVKHATMWETHELIAILLALINSLSLISTWQGTEVIMICCITVHDLCFWNGGRKNACFVSVCQVSIVFEVYSCCWLHWYRIKQYRALHTFIYMIWRHEVQFLYHESWRLTCLARHLSLGVFATCQAIWESWRWKPKNEGRWMRNDRNGFLQIGR